MGACWAAVASVLPSALWRTAVGLGVPLGWSQEQLRAQQIPGWGIVYVIGLSLGSIAAAAMTFGLVQRWGEVVPGWVPVIGGRRIPVGLATGAGTLGGLAVIAICVMSVANWSRVSGFADNPDSPWARLMVACYLPTVAWGPLVLSATWAYWHRRTGKHRV